ncbi:MAG: ASCH domain-containing protein [Salinibacterium sp.]|nr:ASCH domain-containing protein [Salinibacterium sp.]
MTKVLFLSVKPRFARAILEGRKTVEVRRKFPEVPAGTVIVLYSSSPERAVLGTVRLKQMTRVDSSEVWELYSMEIALPQDALAEYLHGALESTLLEVENPETWPIPVTLGALRKVLGVEPPQSFRYLAPEQLEAIRTS